jgi:hypothetical protein|tara:strand:+ start:586 stop:2499 length:1914 start_codon:yes stop_codon:yes gene_type:complete
MASQVSPGVVIKERDLSNAVVVGASALRGAIASSFRKGPVGKIVNIGSERELIDTFGAPSEANAGDWLVASEFLRYGGQLAVVRAATGVLNATLDGSAVLIASKEDYDAGAGSSEKFAARDAGADGNNLHVVIVDSGADWTIAKSGHGLSVGNNYSDDDSVTHEVVEVVDAGTFRVIQGTAAPNPAAGDTATAFTNSNWNATAIGSTGLTYKSIAPRPGTSAFASERFLSKDEVHVAVIDTSTNTIVERLTYLSKLSDGKTPEGNSSYWKDSVNQFSQYIYASALTSAEFTTQGEDPGAAAASYGATSGAPLVLAGILKTAGGGLSGGTDDFAYTAGEIGSAYDLFLDTEETTVDFVLQGGDAANETDTRAKAASVAGVANSRKDCVAFVSPWTGDQIASSGNVALTPAQQLANTTEFMDTIASSSYVVKDSGVKYTYDRFNDKYRYIGCNGDIAGLCVSTSATLDDWFSPAGTNRGGLQNVVKLAFNPNKSQRDDLYSSSINPVVSFPGAGPILFGDKTALASPGAFDRINVRRLFLNIEKRARALAEGILFEQNDSTTRGGFNASMSSYLSEVQARRGVTDFLVVCDDSNNTPEVIDRNEFVAELYLKPTRSINYVTVTVTATRTGVSFAEVVGR